MGLAVSAYLTFVHYAGELPACGISHGCQTVQTSEYASLAGVPVALLGIVGYAAILTLLWMRGDTASLATAMLSTAGFAFSGYLTYLELFEIHAICPYCVTSQVAMTLLVGVTIARALRVTDAGTVPGTAAP